MSDDVLPPPPNFTTWHDHRPVLYQADGKALVRAAGFMPTQSTGQFPQLNTKLKGGKKGKGKGKRGC